MCLVNVPRLKITEHISVKSCISPAKNSILFALECFNALLLILFS